MSLLRFLFSKTFLINAALAALFVGVVLGGTWFYLHAFTGHGKFVEVPDIRGLDLDEAITGLDKYNLEYLVVDSVWNESAVGGSVLEQNPSPGSQVKQDRKVYLTIFRYNPEAVKLDIEEGMNFKIALIKLQNKGIPADTTFEPNVLLHDMVVRVMQNGVLLTPEDMVKPGESVRLVIGRRGNERVPVPDLIGLPLDSAEMKLFDSNLSLGQPFYNESVRTAEDSLNAVIYKQIPTPSLKERVRVGNNVDVYLTTRGNLELKRDPRDLKRKNYE
jgi:beta-lactam-binding protein with PASTA domain